MGIVKEERIGDCRLILGDMMVGLGSTGVAQKDAVLLTDPPYGIGADVAQKAAAESRKNAPRGSKAGRGWKDYGVSAWDTERPARESFDRMLFATSEQIIWGGNYFTDFLPPKMRSIELIDMQHGA